MYHTSAKFTYKLKMTLQDRFFNQLVKYKHSPEGSVRVIECTMEHVAMGGRDSVPGSPSPSIFRNKIHAHKKVRKGEGEPGDEATC